MQELHKRPKAKHTGDENHQQNPSKPHAEALEQSIVFLAEVLGHNQSWANLLTVVNSGRDRSYPLDTQLPAAANTTK